MNRASIFTLPMKVKGDASKQHRHPRRLVGGVFLDRRVLICACCCELPPSDMSAEGEAHDHSQDAAKATKVAPEQQFLAPEKVRDLTPWRAYFITTADLHQRFTRRMRCHKLNFRRSMDL